MAQLPIPSSIYAPGPVSHAFAITPSDVAPLGECTRKLYIDTGGTISVVLNGDAPDAPVAFTVADHAFVDLAVSQVRVTGTSATGIVGLS